MALSIRRSASTARENIYWPGTDAPRGGIVCLHGSEGGLAGWNDLKCALFAAHGFAALAHSYSPNTSWLTHPDIDNVPLDATETALAALRAELAPYGCGMGLFGSSRGAEHALLLAQLLAEDKCPLLPDAVAVHSPPDVTFSAFLVADFQTGQPWAGDRQRPSWSWRGGHERTRPVLPLGVGLQCPVFVSQGTEDDVWDQSLARRLVERMSQSGQAVEAHFFEGEGHTFGATAHNREWELMLDFFGRHLTPGRSPSKPRYNA